MFSSTRCLSQKITSLSRFIHLTPPTQAGHSKWANIKHIKAQKDGQKSALFTAMSRKIRIAVQEGGSNPALNTSLRNLIEEGVRKNMPLATIKNTIKKCETNKTQLSKYILDIKALNKIYVVAIAFTDNFTGLKIQLATVLRKGGASLTECQHLFENMGLVEALATEQAAKDNLEAVCTDDAIECGAEDVQIADPSTGLVQFTCSPIEITRISNELVEKGYKIESAEHIFIPTQNVRLSEQEQKVYDSFLGKLQSLDGIEAVYDNIQVDDE